MSRTAAALIIGNEILSGKIVDTNTTFLARGLFELGIELRRVVVCPDEVPTIAHELSDLRDNHDMVFTSGGVGPTHDDVTIDQHRAGEATAGPGRVVGLHEVDRGVELAGCAAPFPAASRSSRARIT